MIASSFWEYILSTELHALALFYSSLCFFLSASTYTYTNTLSLSYYGSSGMISSFLMESPLSPRMC